MSNRDRTRRARALATDLGRHFDVDATAEYRDRWVIRWVDGPTENTARSWVARRVPDMVDVAYLYRDLSRRAWAVGAVRAAVDGAYGDGYVTVRPYEVEGATAPYIRDREYPDRLDGVREVLVERLLASLPADSWRAEREAAEVVAERGLAVLVEGAGLDVLTPGEVLTARYADTRAEVMAWERTLGTLPTAVLVERALADPGIDREGALALVALLPELRAGWEATEAAILRAAGRVATGTAIGERLGISRQAVSLRLAALGVAAVGGAGPGVEQAEVYATVGEHGRVRHWLRGGVGGTPYCGAVADGPDRPDVPICRSCEVRGESPLQRRLRKTRPTRRR
ncbi:hypothetical protein [Embleya sp. NPDC005971]|uniref:hypothetical protein n=1 Tax=Embleya sp. NPDC005971 TaxID=3156724 RepID=UPI0033C8731A